MNPPRQITAPTPRERATGDLDPRRNRNATSRKPSCLAHRRQTAGVNRGQTPRQNRKAGRAPSKPPLQNRRYGRTPSANAPNKTARTGAHQAQPPRQSRSCRHAERRTSRQPESTCRGVSEFRISPAVPPRAQTPVPALKPARRSIAPAHNPLSHRAEYRFFASARSGVCGRKARRSYSYAEQEKTLWI